MGGLAQGGQGNSFQNASAADSKTKSETTVETKTGSKVFNITNTGGQSNLAMWASRIPWWAWVLMLAVAGGAVWKFKGKK